MPIAGTTAGETQLNSKGPQADRVVAAFAVDEGSGTTLTNQAFARASLGNATIAGGTGSWSASPLYYDFATGDSATFGTATGDVLYQEGTISIVVSDAGSSAAQRMLISSGDVVATADIGHNVLCVFWVSGADTIRVQVRDNNAGVLRTMDFTGQTRNAVNHIVVRWGTGYTARVNGAAPNSSGNNPSTYLGPVRTKDAKSWILGVNNAGVFSDMQLRSLVIWNARLTDDEVVELEHDPYIMHRPPPGKAAELDAATARANSTAYTLGQIRKFATAGAPYQYDDFLYECIIAGTSAGAEPSGAAYERGEVTDGTVTWRAIVPSLFTSWATPWPGRAKTTGASFQFCTSAWLQTASVYVRVKMATTVAGVDGATPVTSSQVTTAATAIRIDVTGLSTATKYFWLAEWSVDNTNWFPFPAGIGTFTTRRTTGDFTFKTFSDCHITAGGGSLTPSDMAWNSDIALARSSMAANSTEGYRNRFAAYRTAHQIYSDTAPDFLIWMGDHAFGDAAGGAVNTNDTTTWKFLTWRSALCFYARMLKRQCNFYVLGNHEGECGYHQIANGGTIATQKQAFNTRIRCICNPDNTTYSEGGEAGNTSAEWVGTGIPALIHDTSTPLQNWYAFTWGNTLFMMLDYCRYSDVGGDDSTYRDYPDQFRFGATQLAWIQSTLAANASANKLIFTHALPGGVSIGQTSKTGYYSRTSGVEINNQSIFAALGVSEGTHEQRLHLLARAYGVEAIIKGHDHGYAVVEVDGVDYITLPTAGAASHTQLTYPGWNQDQDDGSEWEERQNSYGTSQSLGALDSSGAAMSARMLKFYNVIGYVSFTSSTTWTSTLVETCIQTSGADETDINKFITMFDSGTGKGYAERFFANQSHTPASLAIDLSTGDSLNPSPAPTQVYSSVLNSAVTGTWWTGLLTERCAMVNPTAWSTPATLAVGDYRKPTKPNGFIYRVSAITTGAVGATEPTNTGTVATDWPVAVGGTVVDSGVTWTCVSRYNDTYKYDTKLPDGSVVVTNAGAQQVAYTPRNLHQRSIAAVAANPGLLATAGFTRREINYTHRRTAGSF